MTDEATQEQAPRKRASRKDEEQESEAVKTDDERYVGIDPIYANSAYEEPLEPEEGAGETDEEKEAYKAELQMIARVKANEAGNVVNVDEPLPYDEWVEEGSAVATRKLSVRGVDTEQREKDREATEAAKGDDGTIPPHSTSTQQPGVVTVT